MTMSPTPSTGAPHDQVKDLRRRLYAAQRKAALGELLSTTTHEFNNLLTTIINYAKIGLRRRDDETRDRALEKILSAGERAAKVTGVVLGMARRRSDRFDAVNLQEVLEDTLTLLERELSKYRVRVERRMNSVPPALANPGEIQQVLLNLVVNARQAMPDGGVLTVGLSFDEQAEMALLQVRDSGVGIAPEHLPHIFEPHFTTKLGPDETGKGGTGIGLSVCRQIIEAHQGRIRVESALGKGTNFIVKLPIANRQVIIVPEVEASGFSMESEMAK